MNSCHRLRVEHVGEVSPVFVMRHLSLDADEDAVRAIRERCFQHRRWAAGKVALLIVAGQAGLTIGVDDEQRADGVGQIVTVCPVGTVIRHRKSHNGQHLASGQLDPHRAARHVVGVLNQLGRVELRLTECHLPACDAAGVGVLVIKMDGQPVLFGCGHGDVHHLEERLREVRLPQPLPRMDEEATHALPDHLRHLPADFVGR